MKLAFRVSTGSTLIQVGLHPEGFFHVVREKNIMINIYQFLSRFHKIPMLKQNFNFTILISSHSFIFKTIQTGRSSFDYLNVEWRGCLRVVINLYVLFVLSTCSVIIEIKRVISVDLDIWWCRLWSIGKFMTGQHSVLARTTTINSLWFLLLVT